MKFAETLDEVKAMYPQDTPRDIGLTIMQAIHQRLLKTPGHTPGWINYSMPYVKALCRLLSPEDAYGLESGKSVALYALNNLTPWRGGLARECKLRIKALYNIKEN